MNSHWIAMVFAACVTAVLACTAIISGGEIASLPLYALIMVINERKLHFYSFVSLIF